MPIRLKQPLSRNFLLMMMALMITGSALAQGIQFRNDLTFEQVQALAKKENKGIFIDFYTTWCGPCKHMTRYIFTLEKVGAFMEENYISIKIQVDSTGRDNETVRRWRETARTLAARYQVKSFPTMVYLEADGTPVNRIIGSWGSGQFLQFARNGRVRDSGYHAQKNRFTAGDRSVDLLRLFAFSANAANDPVADTAAAMYLAKEKEVYSTAYLSTVRQFTRKTTDTGFALLMNEPAKVNAVLGRGVAQQIAFGIISRQIKSIPGAAEKAAWLKKKYPAQAAQILQYTELTYARDSFDSTVLFQLAKNYISQYGKDISLEDLTSIGVTAASMYTDAPRLEQVLAWLAPTMEDNSANMYPYARAMVLYELNRKSEAIQQIDLAIARAEAFPERMFRAVRDEMVKGGNLREFSFIAE